MEKVSWRSSSGKFHQPGAHLFRYLALLQPEVFPLGNGKGRKVAAPQGLKPLFRQRQIRLRVNIHGEDQPLAPVPVMDDPLAMLVVVDYPLLVPEAGGKMGSDERENPVVGGDAGVVKASFHLLKTDESQVAVRLAPDLLAELPERRYVGVRKHVADPLSLFPRQEEVAADHQLPTGMVGEKCQPQKVER